MISEKFIDFVKDVLPTVDKEKAEELKDWIKDTEKFEYESYYSYEQNDLIQGDIIDGIKFVLMNKEGKIYITDKMKAMVMSTSCDIANDDNITLCPLFENSDLKPGTIEAVKNNLIYDTFYINSKKVEDYHVRFSVCNTVNKDYLFRALEQGKIKKIFTMSMMTYYLFIVKLTIHYMRMEDSEVKGLRKDKNSSN